MDWPEYDILTDDPEDNETAYLHHLTTHGNAEMTPQNLADRVNQKFGNNRTADDVSDKLATGEV